MGSLSERSTKTSARASECVAYAVHSTAGNCLGAGAGDDTRRQWQADG